MERQVKRVELFRRLWNKHAMCLHGGVVASGDIVGHLLDIQQAVFTDPEWLGFERLEAEGA